MLSHFPSTQHIREAPAPVVAAQFNTAGCNNCDAGAGACVQRIFQDSNSKQRDQISRNCGYCKDQLALESGCILTDNCSAKETHIKHNDFQVQCTTSVAKLYPSLRKQLEDCSMELDLPKFEDDIKDKKPQFRAINTPITHHSEFFMTTESKAKRARFDDVAHVFASTSTPAHSAVVASAINGNGVPFPQPPSRPGTPIARPMAKPIMSPQPPSRKGIPIVQPMAGRTALISQRPSEQGTPNPKRKAGGPISQQRKPVHRVAPYSAPNNRSMNNKALPYLDAIALAPVTTDSAKKGHETTKEATDFIDVIRVAPDASDVDFSIPDLISSDRASTIKRIQYKATAKAKKEAGILPVKLIQRPSRHSYQIFGGNPPITPRPKADQVEDENRWKTREDQHEHVLKQVPVVKVKENLHTVIDFFHGIGCYKGLFARLIAKGAQHVFTPLESSKLHSLAGFCYEMLSDSHKQSNYQGYQRCLALYGEIMEMVLEDIQKELAGERQHFETAKLEFLNVFDTVELDNEGFLLETLHEDEEAPHSTWFLFKMASIRLKEVTSRFAAMKDYLVKPTEFHGIAFLEKWARLPKKNNRGKYVDDGALGHKATSADMPKTAFCFLLRVYNCLYDGLLDENPRGVIDAVAQINRDSAKYFTERDRDVQKGKHLESLNDDDMKRIVAWYLNSGMLGVGPYRALATDNGLNMTGGRSHQLREANDINIGTRFRDLSYANQTHKVEVLCVAVSHSKNTHLFATVGANNKQYLDLAPHKDPGRCTIVAVAVMKYLQYNVFQQEEPPFHKGYEASMNYKLFQGNSATSEIADSTQREAMRDCHIAVGVYNKHLVLHRSRHEIVDRCVVKGVPLDEAKRIGWQDSPDTNGKVKKTKDTVDTHYYSNLTHKVLLGLSGFFAEEKHDPQWMKVTVPRKLIEKGLQLKSVALLKEKIDSGHPDFANNDSFKGVVDSYNLYARVLYPGVAGWIVFKYIDKDHYLVRTPGFVGPEFQDVVKNVFQIYEPLRPVPRVIAPISRLNQSCQSELSKATIESRIPASEDTLSTRSSSDLCSPLTSLTISSLIRHTVKESLSEMTQELKVSVKDFVKESLAFHMGQTLKTGASVLSDNDVEMSTVLPIVALPQNAKSSDSNIMLARDSQLQVSPLYMIVFSGSYDDVTGFSDSSLPSAISLPGLKHLKSSLDVYTIVMFGDKLRPPLKAVEMKWGALWRQSGSNRSVYKKFVTIMSLIKQALSKRGQDMQVSSEVHDICSQLDATTEYIDSNGKKSCFVSKGRVLLSVMAEVSFADGMRWSATK